MKCEHYWRDGLLRVEQGEQDPHRDACVDCRRAHAQRDQLVRALSGVGATSAGAPDWQAQVWIRIAREEAARARHSYWLAAGLAAACAAIVVCVLYFGRHSQDVRLAYGTSNGVARVPDHMASAGDLGFYGGVASAPAPQVPPARLAPAAAGSSRSGGSFELARRITSVQPRPYFEIVSGQLAMRMRSISAWVGDRVRITVAPGQEVRVYCADRLVLRCPEKRTAPGCVPDAQGMVAETELATSGECQLVVISSATAEPAGTLDRDLAAVVLAGGEYKVTELIVR